VFTRLPAQAVSASCLNCVGRSVYVHSSETSPYRSLSLSSRLHRPLSDLADRHSATYCTARTARTAPAPGKRWAAPGATDLAGGCSQGSHLATRRRHRASVELPSHLKGLADRHSASHALYRAASLAVSSYGTRLSAIRCPRDRTRLTVIPSESDPHSELAFSVLRPFEAPPALF
jgi:hypothetical protein